MSERPWIEHTGDGCPFRNGVKIDAVMTDGAEFRGWPIENACRPISHPRNTWDFRSPARRHVKRYRLHDDGQAESERRAERMEQFRKIAAGKEHLVEETLKPRTPAPQKAGL